MTFPERCLAIITGIVCAVISGGFIAGFIVRICAELGIRL